MSDHSYPHWDSNNVWKGFMENRKKIVENYVEECKEMLERKKYTLKLIERSGRRKKWSIKNRGDEEKQGAIPEEIKNRIAKSVS